MLRVRSLGLPAIAKSLYSVGLYGAEIGGMSASNMRDVRGPWQRSLRRSSPLELMAFGLWGTGWRPAGYRGCPGWQCEEQYFTWYEADQKVKWDVAKNLLAEVAANRPDFQGLETGLSTQTYRHLTKSSARADDKSRSAVNAALGGVWHEERTHRAFAVGDLCVRCKEEVENLSHILFEPALVYLANVGTVWTDGSGKHSSDPHHRRCGVGYYTNTQERVWLPLPRIKQSVYRAEFLAVVNRTKIPKGRNRDLEKRAQLPQADVITGRITADVLYGNGQADVLANQGMTEHGWVEPDATWSVTLRTRCTTSGA
eukprot:4565594-Amphidinium_carterae.1